MLSPILFTEPGLHRHRLQASDRCFWHLCWLNSGPAGYRILCVSHSGLWDCVVSEFHSRWSPWREVWRPSQLSPRDIASLESLLFLLLLTLSFLFAFFSFVCSSSVPYLSSQMVRTLMCCCHYVTEQVGVFRGYHFRDIKDLGHV